MKLNIYTANNQTDIMHSQLGYIKQNLKSGRKQYIIVPDKFSLTMEKEVMQGLNLNASFGFEVLTFARFANLIVDIKDSKILSSLGATMIIQMLLEKHKAELKCFNKTIKSINFASVIFDSIAQLKACNITASSLKNALPNIKNKLLQSKLSDISFIMQKYEDYLGQEYIDSANRLQLLSQGLKYSQVLKDIDVHFCHFDTTTPKALDIISQVLKTANSVSVGVVVADKNQPNKYIYDDKMLKDILDISKDCALTPNIIEAPSVLSLNSRHILSNLMANNYNTLNVDNSVFVSVANTIENEVKFVAMDISNKIRNGQRYKDMVVNCTSLEQYAPVINKVFKSYNLPVWVDLPYKLSDSELIKFLNTTFALINNNYTKEDVIIYSKNILCGLDDESQMLFERVINKYDISRDLVFKNFELQDEEYQQFFNICQNLFKPVEELKSQILKSTTISQYVVCVQNYLNSLNIQQKLEDLAIKNFEQQDLYNQSINRQVFLKLDKCLNTIYDIMAEYQTSFEDFCAILNSGIQTINISPLPMAIDCVYVGQNLQSVFSVVPNLYIIGAHDGAFPSVVSDVGIVSDIDIAELKGQKVNLTPTIAQVNAQSLKDVVQNTALFSGQLCISYALQSSDGQHSKSSALESLINIFTQNEKPLKVVDISSYLNDDSAFKGQQNRLLYIWGNLNNALSNVIQQSNSLTPQISTNLLSTAVKVLKERGFNDVFNNLEEFNSVFNKNQSINANLLDKEFLSVTELERYFMCPYLHFVDYNLRLQENKTSDILSMDNGNIIHAVLEKFMLYYNKAPNLTEKQIKDVVVKIFNQVMQQPDFVRFSKNNKHAFALKKLSNECVRAVQAVVFQLRHSKYSVKYVEKSFGSTGFIPLPEIAVLNKTIKIKGKVDRLDCYNGVYRIIDYKTSKNAGKFSLLDLYLGKKIQLFYYMYAILQGLNKKGENASSGGVYYLPIHREYTTNIDSKIYDGYRMEGLTVNSIENIFATDDTLSPDNLESAVVDLTLPKKFMQEETTTGNKLCSDLELNHILNYTNKIVVKAITEIMHGYIAPKPLDGACEYCKYQNICKINCNDTLKERNKDYKVDIKSFEGIE